MDKTALSFTVVYKKSP